MLIGAIKGEIRSVEYSSCGFKPGCAKGPHCFQLLEPGNVHSLHAGQSQGRVHLPVACTDLTGG